MQNYIDDACMATKVDVVDDVRISFSCRRRASMPNVAPPHRIACRMPHTWNAVLFRHEVKYITQAEHNQEYRACQNNISLSTFNLIHPLQLPLVSKTAHTKDGIATKANYPASTPYEDPKHLSQ